MRHDAYAEGLKLSAKGQHVQAHGLGKSEWVLTRIPAWLPWLTRWSPILNPMMNNPMMRWLLEHLTGIAKERRSVFGVLPINLVHVRLGRKFTQSPGNALLICNLLAVGRQKLLRLGLGDRADRCHGNSDPGSNADPDGKLSSLGHSLRPE